MWLSDLIAEMAPFWLRFQMLLSTYIIIFNDLLHSVVFQNNSNQQTVSKWTTVCLHTTFNRSNYLVLELKLKCDRVINSYMFKQKENIRCHKKDTEISIYTYMYVRLYIIIYIINSAYWTIFNFLSMHK